MSRIAKMKKLVLIAAALPLCSCFYVDDFGAYWEKTKIDKRLTGNWKLRVPPSGSTDDLVTPHLGSPLQVVERDGSSQALYPDGSIPFRTLSDGRYQFLAMGPTKGRLQRYKLTARTLELCAFPDDDLVLTFLKDNFPRATNVGYNGGEGRYADIYLLDDAVFSAISRIPDTKAYWICDAIYERIP